MQTYQIRYTNCACNSIIFLYFLWGNKRQFELKKGMANHRFKNVAGLIELMSIAIFRSFDKINQIFNFCFSFLSFKCQLQWTYTFSLFILLMFRWWLSEAIMYLNNSWLNMKGLFDNQSQGKKCFVIKTKKRTNCIIPETFQTLLPFAR